MLAYVHKYLCYSAEQSLKRNEVSAAVTGTLAYYHWYNISCCFLLSIPSMILSPQCGLFSSAFALFRLENDEKVRELISASDLKSLIFISLLFSLARQFFHSLSLSLASWNIVITNWIEKNSTYLRLTKIEHAWYDLRIGTLMFNDLGYQIFEISKYILL